MNKKCERCGVNIPDDYENLLCDSCYQIAAKETEQRIQEENENRKAQGVPTQEEVNKQSATPHVPVSGIIDPNYKENPEQEEINMIQRNMTQFIKTGKWLWTNQRTMYEFIKNSFRDIVVNHPQYPKFVWKPTVCDVGCGTGLGSNILSQEADFVWGIDKNPQNVAFATEMFARQKNNIYYTPEIRFDVIDAVNPPPNVEMKFDVVVAIEIFEHIADTEKFLEFIKGLCHPAIVKGNREALRATDVWLSTPNRNNKHISSEKPNNKYHVRELTQEEFLAVLQQHFKYVELFNSIGKPVVDTNTHTPLLAFCKEPI